jgi:uncharacterized protein
MVEDSMKRDKIFSAANLIVKPSLIHGYGVFANRTFNNGDIIEECYALCVEPTLTSLSNYLFSANKKCLLPLGFGAIYNHSNIPNANCHIQLLDSKIIFKANQVIKKGEEIFISYGENWLSQRQIPYIAYTWRLKTRRILSMFMVGLRFILIILMIFASAKFLQN